LTELPSSKALLLDVQRLGAGGFTVLVEGGGKLLGCLFDQHLVDKVLAFISPIIIGGREAASVGGNGADNMAEALRLSGVDIESFGDDILVSGYTK